MTRRVRIRKKIKSRDEREREALMLADYIIKTRCTITELDRRFGIPRSTVHRRLSKTLIDVDKHKWEECKEIFKEHIDDRVNRSVQKRREKRAQ